MHALHNIHAALVPEAILVDTQPISAHPPVAAGGVTLGTLDMREWIDTIHAVDECFVETVRAGLYEPRHESRFVVMDAFDGPSAWTRSAAGGARASRTACRHGSQPPPRRSQWSRTFGYDSFDACRRPRHGANPPFAPSRSGRPGLLDPGLGRSASSGCRVHEHRPAAGRIRAGRHPGLADGTARHSSRRQLRSLRLARIHGVSSAARRPRRSTVTNRATQRSRLLLTGPAARISGRKPKSPPTRLGARGVEPRQTEFDSQGQHTVPEGKKMAGAIDPTSGRKNALDAFLELKLREGFEIETHTDTHAIIVEPNRRKSLLHRFGGRRVANRYVVSVDEHAEVTMVPAEPKRS